MRTQRPWPVVTGLAASALLAGTVALATSGPVAEIAAADAARPAVIVPGGATVGAPDPTSSTGVPPLAAMPSSSASSSSTGPTADAAEEASPVRAPTRAQRPAAAPVREVAASAHPTSGTSTKHPSDAPTTTTEPAGGDDHGDQDEGTEPTTTTPKPGELVGGVLHGVGGLVDGVLGGGRR